MGTLISLFKLFRTSMYIESRSSMKRETMDTSVTKNYLKRSISMASEDNQLDVELQHNHVSRIKEESIDDMPLTSKGNELDLVCRVSRRPCNYRGRQFAYISSFSAAAFEVKKWDNFHPEEEKCL